MKAHSCSIVLGIVLFTLAAPLRGQIRDTESSVALLAMNCSASSGYAASNYEGYCTRLAKTLGVLSGEQQVRIFGYLPTPTVGGTSAEPNPTATTGQTPVTTTPVTGSPTTGPSASTGTSVNSGNTSPVGQGGSNRLQDFWNSVIDFFQTLQKS